MTLLKNIKIITIVTISILLLVCCNSRDTEKNEEDSNKQIGEGLSPPNNIDLIREQVKKMTLDEKIGQMLILGFEGYMVDKEVLSLIDDYHVGGFILFKRNIENNSQLLGLLNDLKEANSQHSIPLFLSLDEEGGRVSRLTVELEALPSNEIIGEKNDSDFSFEIGNIIGEKLRGFGFNMDFAPVFDINSNPNNPVIGDRSFGSNPEVVRRLGVATMKGIQNKDVISVIKHFPGHGDTSVDSHLGLPKVDKGLEGLENFELKPFKGAIEDGADAIMISHILFPQIDDENPASLSHSIITNILRDKMNFEGIVITDDLTMGAIIDNYSIEEAVIKAVIAGSDIVLVCHDYDKEFAAIKTLKDAVKDGVISEARIDESVYRILKLKKEYGLNNNTIENINIDHINKKTSDILNRYMN